MKKRMVTLLAILVFLLACAAFSSSAENGVVSPWDAAAPVAFDGSVCPHCVAQGQSGTGITWEEWTPGTFASGKHYKISSSYQLTSYYNCSVECVIWIQDHVTLTAKDGSNAFRVNGANSELWLLGGKNAVLTGTGAAAAASSSGGAAGRTTTNGGLLRLVNHADAEMHIGGDLTICLSGPVSTGMGGLVDVFLGTLYMHDGTLLGVENAEGGAFDASGKAATSYGAVISRSTGNFVMEGGRIKGGSSTQPAPIYMEKGNVTIKGDAYIEAADGEISGNGGAIYVNNGTLQISGGTITGGCAEKGGALYLNANATVTMTGGTINGCTITNETATAVKGGAIYSVATGSVQFNGGTINGGVIARSANSANNITSLKGKGGAIYLDGGQLTLGGVNIVGGKAHEGGCVYVNAGTLNMTAGTMSGGDGLSNGGTMFLKGTMNMSGGTIIANPQNTYAYSKGIRVANGKLNLSGTAHVISAGDSEGGAIYAVTVSATGLAKVSLADEAKVTNPNGSQTNNIFISNWGPDDSTDRYAAKIEVKAGWSGTASVKFGYIYSSSYAIPGAAYSIGMQFPADYAAATGDFDGNLYMEVAPYTPTLWWDGASGLHASDVQLCTDEGITWVKDNAAAVNACGNGYIKLYNTDPLDLNGNTAYVDFNGNSSSVTLNGGKLYGFDSTASVQAPGTSRVTVVDGDAECYAVNPVAGKTAFARTESGITTFHAVQISIDSVSLRPGTAGIYYSAQFLCDDVLKENVDTFGLALSLVDMPGADFATDQDVIYTTNSKEAYGASSYNSVLVNQIMTPQQNAETNQNNAETVIYANAYMVLRVNGEAVTAMAENPTQLSLKNVLKRVDKRWHSLDSAARNEMLQQIYAPFVSKFTGNDWALFNLESATADPNRELKILTIGNSLAVDATRMLAYVAKQEGSVGIKVGTLYKANCSVQEHADFLTNDKPRYWYYESGFDANDPGTLTEGSLVPSETKNYLGYDAIVAEDWDIIVMQHSVFGSGQPETYDESIDTIINYVNTHKTNPNAIFVWNMTWMPPVDDELLASAEVEGRSPGFGKSYTRYTKDPLDREAQTMMYEMIAASVQEKIYDDDRFAYILPSATMMQDALTATSDKVMYRDYIHGSDYGRLMNAYLWYSMFTGKTITEPAVDVIPGALRQASANRGNDLTLTQRQQDILVESIANAQKEPFVTTVSKYQKTDALKVLAIGNSFSQDAMRHLEEIARSEGYVNIKLGNLYIGGSTLKTNWTKADGDLGDYTYYYNFDGNWEKVSNYKISQAMADQDWDIVTLQQASGSSGQASTFEPYLTNLIDYVQTNEPNAKIVWHMTWAYAQDSTHSSFPNYDSNQMTMYQAIMDTAQSVVVPYVTAGKIDKIIPSGTAIQNARTSYVGDEFDRDGYHLSVFGRIVAACTWYSTLTGDQLDELSVTYFEDSELSNKPPVTLTDKDRAMIIESVNNALDTPYQVTNSAYTQ